MATSWALDTFPEKYNFPRSRFFYAFKMVHMGIFKFKFSKRFVGILLLWWRQIIILKTCIMINEDARFQISFLHTLYQLCNNLGTYNSKLSFSSHFLAHNEATVSLFIIFLDLSWQALYHTNSTQRCTHSTCSVCKGVI